MYAGGGSRGSRGMLVNNRTGEQVDLFLIDHEEASLKNDITGENLKDLSQLDEHVEMRPAEVTVSGYLVEATYSENSHGQAGSVNKMPTSKLNKIVKFCNDAEPNTSYTLWAPNLPYNYVDYYPTDFTYQNEGQKNAVVFDLTLEEIGQQKKLRRGTSTTTNTTGVNRSSKDHSRYHASIASPTEDGGGQIERGEPSVVSLSNVLKVESLNERVDQRKMQVAPEGTTVTEMVSKLLGARKDLANRSTVMSFQGMPSLSSKDMFTGADIEGGIGQALNQRLEGAYFPSTAPLNDKELGEKSIVENIPVMGGILEEIKGLPRNKEFVIEVVKSNSSTILVTQKSPVMRRVRDYIINQGVQEDSGVDLQRLRDNTILSSRENRILEDSFIEGLSTLRSKAREHESLRGFVTELPQIGEEDSLTYYNYYGQPVISFEGVLDVDFGRWATQDVTLNNETYEMETYWNSSGFPIVSLAQTDGTQILKQSRAFMGADLLESAQSAPNLQGVHIIPFSLVGNDEIVQDNIGLSTFFGVVHSNRQALERVI